MESREICTSGISTAVTQWSVGALLFLAPLYLIIHFRNKGKPMAPYGKHLDSKQESAVKINPKLGWFLQESPSFFVPMILLYNSGMYTDLLQVNVVLWFLFTGHYFYRTIIYPVLGKRGGHQLPLSIAISSFIFTSLNGFIQGNTLLCATYPKDWLQDARFITGLTLFVAGIYINIHSDRSLRNLRKPGETGYKIPKGGMFEYISSANYFGEIVEWFGFAIACWNSLPAWAFALHTLGSIGARGAAHHRYYLKKFENYPKGRKAVIPFIW